MAKSKVKPFLSAFTSKGEVYAVILPDGVLNVLNTSGGDLFAEWKHSDEDSEVQFSCIACSFVGKKRKKENATCLVALGTEDGEVFVIDATTSKIKWKSSEQHQGKIAALSFANKGRKLCVVSTDGTTCEMNSENGELVKEIKIPKKYISSSVHISDDKILAAANTKIRALCLEDGEELLKFSTDSGPVQHMCMLEGENVIITSTFNDKNLQVWKTESTTEKVTSGPILSMEKPPLSIECKKGCNGDELVVLSVSESGVAYMWNLKTLLPEDNINLVPTTIIVKATDASGKKKKGRSSVLAARLSSISEDHVRVFIVYGSSINSLQITSVDIDNPGDEIILYDVEEDGEKDQKNIRGKKRTASDADSENAGLNPNHDQEDPMEGVQTDNDINEPTMGEKLASLNIMKNEDEKSHEKAETLLPPSADSVHVLLKQALNADDRSLLLDCLFRKDEKIIRNSISILNPSDVFKLLESLISMIQSRGAVVACALPWLKSLLLQHASSIMSQESSLIALNSLYQLIESRISTFDPVIQLSSSLDLLYTKTVDDGVDEGEGSPMEPIIFEDVSDEEESEEEENEAIETEEDNEELEEVSNVSDLEGSDAMAEY